MNECTLVFPCLGYGVILGMKKRGFGKDKWNGFGGHLEAGETPERCAVRELKEEAGVKVPITSLVRVATLVFLFPEKPKDNHLVYVYTESYIFALSEFRETEEMKPGSFDATMLPYERMWPDDRFWLHAALTKRGGCVEGIFTFSSSGSITKASLTVS